MSFMFIIANRPDLMLSVNLLNVIMLNVIMLSAVMLSVVAPPFDLLDLLNFWFILDHFIFISFQIFKDVFRSFPGLSRSFGDFFQIFRSF